MKGLQKCVLAVTLIIFSLTVSAAGRDAIRLTHAKVNTKDLESIKRGAKFFATNCMVCHSLRQLEHDELSQQAGITIDKMPLKDQNWWFGATPPDLSLIARVRTPDWIYTYLHSFYKDPASKLGSNNLLVPNSKMTNPFAGMQGDQVLAVNIEDLDQDPGVFAKRPSYFTILYLERQGSMDPTEFNDTINDLVTYLVYASDPGKLQRQHLGWWVIGFLLILVILTFLLNREYWRNVKFP